MASTADSAKSPFSSESEGELFEVRNRKTYLKNYGTVVRNHQKSVQGDRELLTVCLFVKTLFRKCRFACKGSRLVVLICFRRQSYHIFHD